MDGGGGAHFSFICLMRENDAFCLPFAWLSSSSVGRFVGDFGVREENVREGDAK